MWKFSVWVATVRLWSCEIVLPFSDRGVSPRYVTSIVIAAGRNHQNASHMRERVGEWLQLLLIGHMSTFETAKRLSSTGVAVKLV